MGLIKRNNIYYFRIMINGHEVRRSLHTQNKAIAKKLHEAWQYKYIENKINGIDSLPLISLSHTQSPKAHQNIDISKPSLETAFREHLRVSKGNFISEESYQCKERLLSMLIKEKISWDDNLPTQLLELQEKLRADLAVSTADKYITFLKAFMKYCLDRGYLDLSLYVKIPFLKRQKSQKNEVVFTDDELQAIRDYCIRKGDLDLMYYFITLFLTGARPNEILKMTHNDIDFKNNTITIWMNKTQNRKTTPINSKYLVQLRHIAYLNSLDNGCIFYGSLRNKEYYGHKFREMKNELGLHPRCSRYTFRHTSATRAYDFTKDIYLVSEFLGHQDIKTTTGYISSNTERKRPLQDELMKAVYT
ncbi:MAG: tyrosine-type recombinase/integrase [Brevinema sp.]